MFTRWYQITRRQEAAVVRVVAFFSFLVVVVIIYSRLVVVQLLHFRNSNVSSFVIIPNIEYITECLSS